ncbi:uncharacterized protein LOC110678163 [Aedes aegypti]|uniref:Uncharacterized protein n=1 Tax=Aedes aegypti TaxID=7159 RepID=A0A6I8U4Z2_AEDAE|nr:uncharacterized protein LOC110678163 [Aedes aegypti]
MEISTRQTGENLKTRIEEVLELHNTNVLHVYSCTTDNGKNMLKCVSELDKSQQLALETELTSRESEQSAETAPEDFDDDPEECKEDDVAKLDKEVDEMLEAVENIFLEGNESCIAMLKCAAHTINLVVKDVVSTEDDILKKIRKVVKACRKTEFAPFFDLAKAPLPKTDVETRWGSLFDMINSFFKREDFYKDLGEKFSEIHLTNEEWIYIKEFVMSFEPLNILTKNVQADNLVLGDVYKFLKICQLKLKQIPPENRFAKAIEEALNTRSKRMMDNDAFRSALLFDQRWCFMDSPYVTPDDKLAAIEHMLKASNISKSFKPAPLEEMNPDATRFNPSVSAEDDLEALLEEECK